MSHLNTLAAYREMRPAFHPREQAIIAQLQRGPMTDREIMHALHFAERNAVAPRITHLIQMGVCEEVGDTDCACTGKRVRIVALCKKGTGEQLELMSA